MSTCFVSLHSGHVHKRRSSFTETQKSIDFMNIFYKSIALIFAKDAILTETIAKYWNYI